MIRRLAILGLVAATMACGSGRSDSQDNGNNNNNNNSLSGLDPTSPNLVYATNWQSLKITANFAVTTLDSAAHFTTTRNACGKRTDGVLSVSDWNSFATVMNAAAAAPALPSEKCVDIANRDWASFKFDGAADLVFLSNSTRSLMNVRGGQVCHTIGNDQLASQLIDFVNKVVLAADKQDCPNGWGSG